MGSYGSLSWVRAIVGGHASEWLDWLAFLGASDYGLIWLAFLGASECWRVSSLCIARLLVLACRWRLFVYCVCVCSFIVCRWRLFVYCSFVFVFVYFAFISRVLVFVFVLFAFSVSYVGVSFLCSSRLFVLHGVVFVYFVFVCVACSLVGVSFRLQMRSHCDASGTRDTPKARLVMRAVSSILVGPLL